MSNWWTCNKGNKRQCPVPNFKVISCDHYQPMEFWRSFETGDLRISLQYRKPTKLNLFSLISPWLMFLLRTWKKPTDHLSDGRSMTNGLFLCRGEFFFCRQIKYEFSLGCACFANAKMFYSWGSSLAFHTNELWSKRSQQLSKRKQTTATNCFPIPRLRYAYNDSLCWSSRRAFLLSNAFLRIVIALWFVYQKLLSERFPFAAPTSVGEMKKRIRPKS